VTIVIAVVLFLAVFGGLVWYTRRDPSGNVKVGVIDDDVWASAAESMSGSVLERTVPLGKPFAQVPFIWDSESTLHRFLRRRLLAAGGMYGSSPEVFLSIQVGLTLVGAAIIGLGIGGILPAFPAAILAAVVCAYPFAHVDQKARRRTELIGDALPEFAEMLMMPLSSGQSVMQSLRFCADQIKSPVADEVRHMLQLVSSRAMDETTAFRYAGERLGTPESRSFFAALLSAQVEGTKVLDNIAGQADALRTQMYQRRRAEAKKLPVKLVMIFGLHLLPLLFIIAGIPVLVALTQL
jgi:Flp pilus assembly protein TadB